MAKGEQLWAHLAKNWVLWSSFALQELKNFELTWIMGYRVHSYIQHASLFIEQGLQAPEYANAKTMNSRAYQQSKKGFLLLTVSSRSTMTFRRLPSIPAAAA